MPCCSEARVDQPTLPLNCPNWPRNIHAIEKCRDNWVRLSTCSVASQKLASLSRQCSELIRQILVLTSFFHQSIKTKDKRIKRTTLDSSICSGATIRWRAQ